MKRSKETHYGVEYKDANGQWVLLHSTWFGYKAKARNELREFIKTHKDQVVSARFIKKKTTYELNEIVKL